MKNLTESVVKVSKMTMEKIAELKIPPYPKYYSETFLDSLKESKDKDLIAFHDENPLYFYSCIKSQDVITNSLFLARDSVYKFEHFSEMLKSMLSECGMDLRKLSEDPDLKAQDFLDAFEKFESKVNKKIKQSKKNISQLNEKIESVEDVVNIHPLTKMPNIVEYEKDMQVVFHDSNVEDLNLFLFVVAVDDFSDICSQYGRLAGDKTVIFLSTFLKHYLSGGAKIYHADIDKFYVVLNHVQKRKVLSTINGIISEVSKSKIFYRGHNITLNVSAGVTRYQPKDSIDVMTERAREALVGAKITGNCYKERF